MNKKNYMRDFIILINDNGLMTKFIRNIFDYNNFNDYNYMFRMIDSCDEIILDIYDNVSNTKFNRYIFNFSSCDYDVIDSKDNDIFVKYISVLNVVDSNNDKLLKLAYLFKIDDNMILEYASSFLDNKFVDMLRDIIK